MKNTNNTLAAIQLNQVAEQLKQDDSLLMQAYCDYSEGNNYDRVYDNDEDSINMMFDNAYDALRAASHGDYNHSHAYFTFNGYGNLQSFEYLDSDGSPIDIGELAQWLIDEDRLGKYKITVTTLDDMLASIEDNITDDNNKLDRLFEYLNIPMYYQCFDGRDTDKVSEAMNEINNYSYEQLNKLITDLNISYE